MSAIEPAPCRHLTARRTAEALGLPLACRNRLCRRRRRCLRLEADGQPACRLDLEAERRGFFDGLHDLVRLAATWPGPMPVDYISEDPATRLLQDLAVEIAGACLPARERRRFAAYWRARALPPPSPSSPPPKIVPPGVTVRSRPVTDKGDIVF